jgi:hypothetical protein
MIPIAKRIADALHGRTGRHRGPALVMHFPERDTVREVPRSGGRGIFVGDPGGSDGICFFWHTSDRIDIVSAPQMSERTRPSARRLQPTRRVPAADLIAEYFA